MPGDMKRTPTKQQNSMSNRASVGVAHALLLTTGILFSPASSAIDRPESAAISDTGAAPERAERRTRYGVGYEYRMKRQETSNRPDHPIRDRVSDRPEKIERPETIARPEPPQRPDRVERPDRPEKIERPEPIERPSRPERHERPGR